MPQDSTFDWMEIGKLLSEGRLDIRIHIQLFLDSAGLVMLRQGVHNKYSDTFAMTTKTIPDTPVL